MKQFLFFMSLPFLFPLAGCRSDDIPDRDDLEVLSAVAAHFASHADLGPAYGDGIVLIDRSSAMMSREVRRSAYFSAEDRIAERADSHMLEDIFRRNDKSVVLSRLEPTRLYRVRTEIEEMQRPNGSRYNGVKTDAALSLPGYSRFGGRALVYLVIPSWTHGAHGTYVLERESGKWTVESSNLVLNFL